MSKKEVNLSPVTIHKNVNADSVNDVNDVVEQVEVPEFKPLVSVLIPVYNVEKYLAKCLSSVVRQTLKNIEIIVVNDGSTDSSLQIIKKFAQKDHRIIVVDKKNSGYGNSMNIGLSKATGEYIGIVESDDFVAPNMFESLYNLSYGGADRNNEKEIRNASRVDVIKGNYYDYYGVPSKPSYAEPNREREMIPDSKTPFTLKENGQISWGHPSVWSAIYRREFLEENGIRFIEEKGGGWVDNPFFYETLAKAQSIMWTNVPYYYYFRGNPNSSSNKQGDPTLPFKRMLENLDVLKKTGFTDELAVRCAYARALMYLNGAIKDFDFDANEKIITDYAAKLMRDLDPKVISSFNLSDQFEYYTYASSYPRIAADKKKILFYNWCPFDNQWKFGGGVTVYLRNLIEEIIKDDPQISVYMLSSGFAYDATKLETFTRKIPNVFGRDCHQYEIVNSPVPAEQRFIFRNPTVALKNESLKKEFESFLKKYGPFEVVHFNNLEGISLDVFDLKKSFPETKFAFSIHNYVPFCLTGFYFMRHKHCVCNPKHTAKDCEKCAENGRFFNFSSEVYGRGKFGVPAEKCYSAGKWTKNFGFERLDVTASAEELVSFAKTAVEEINRNCDSILAVSKRVYDIAADNGIDKSKMFVSYIGTKVAETQRGGPSEELLSKLKSKTSLKVVFLGNDINFEEKGYPFLIESLEKLDAIYASKIDLVLTVKQKEHYELYEAFAHFKSLKIINGYTHKDLPQILKDCDLSIVPVIWEDNLPQIAIESVAYGVPVLASSAGGAAELCDSAMFKFKAGDSEDFLEKLIHFVRYPLDLHEYWKHHHGLMKMNEHWKELKSFFKFDTSENDKVVSAEDYIWQVKERDFLRSQVKNYISNGFIPPAQFNSVCERLGRAEAEVKRLNEEKKELIKKKGTDMAVLKGKSIFMTVNKTEDGEVGASLIKITIPKFECSDFVADISFILLNNISPSVSDQLTLSGSWLKSKDDEGKFYLRIHQIDWLKKDEGLRDWISVYVDDNSVVIFGRHPGQFSGYSFIVNNLTSRGSEDKIDIVQMSSVAITNNEVIPVNALSKLI